MYGDAEHTEFGSSLRERLFWKPRRRMGNNIKMDLQQMECENLDWIHLDEDGTTGGVL